MPDIKTAVTSHGQINTPAELRQQDGIVPGHQFRVGRVASRQDLLRREPKQDNADLVDSLRACSALGWFRDIPSESTVSGEVKY